MRSAVLLVILWLFYPPANVLHIPKLCPETVQKAQQEASTFHYGSNRSGTYPQNELLWHYDVKYYGLDVFVDPEVNAIEGSVHVVATVTQAGLNIFVLELLDNMQVDSVIMNGQNLAFIHENDELLIQLQKDFQKNELIEFKVYYQGFPESSGFFSGFSIGMTPYSKPVLWTLSEPLNARQWWPVKQVLEDKADSLMVRITTPKSYKAVSNGLLVDESSSADDLISYTWKSYYPVAYYLISLAVSEYAEYSFHTNPKGSNEKIFVQNFIYDDPSYFEEQKHNIDRTADFLQIFSTLFGIYPFSGEKYGHVTAPISGGMEHQTITTLSAFNSDLVAHELAHQWFGNSVTCASWSDVWVNEGFASYSEYLAREKLEGQAQAEAWLNAAYQNVISSPAGSVYIPPLETTDVWRIFDGRLSYKKGAALLHMLRNEINDDPIFFQVLQTFQETYADSVATGDDFRVIAEQVTGSDWEYFFDQWYYGEGYPIFDIFWWTSNDTLYLRTVQQGSADFPEFFKTSFDVSLITDSEPVEVRFFQNQAEQTFKTHIGQSVLDVVFDPKAWLLKKASILQKHDETLVNETRVYPNPFNRNFTILTKQYQPGRTYRIFDPNGKLIQEGEITGLQTRINFNPKSGGNLYFLEVVYPLNGKSDRVKLIRLEN